MIMTEVNTSVASDSASQRPQKKESASTNMKIRESSISSNPPSQETGARSPLLDLEIIEIPASTTFPQFWILPLELQNHVWYFAANAEKRTIEVRFSKQTRSKKHAFVSKTPTILHATHHSRNEGLRHYTKLGNKHSVMNAYFNFQIDTLYIRGGNGKWNDNYKEFRETQAQQELFLKDFAPRNQIKFIAISYREMSDLQSWRIAPRTNPTILYFPNLEEVTVLQETWKEKRMHDDIDLSELKKCDCYMDDQPEGRKASNSTVFLDLAQLQHHLDHHRGETTKGANIGQGHKDIERFKKLMERNRWGPQPQWTVPNFSVGGVMHNHKKNDWFWVRPYGESTLVTRSRASISNLFGVSVAM